MERKKRKMSDQPHNMNNEFDNLLVESDHHMLNKQLSHFYTRPAYYGTSQQMGGTSDGKNTKESES